MCSKYNAFENVWGKCISIYKRLRHLHFINPCSPKITVTLSMKPIFIIHYKGILKAL